MFGSMAYTAPGAGRWTARRKAELLEAINTGAVSKEEVLQQYGLGADELDEWLRRYHTGDKLQARRRLRALDMSVRSGGRPTVS